MGRAVSGSIALLIAATVASHIGAVPRSLGSTRRCERRPGWIERHQEPSGAWSSARFTDRCSDCECDGEGSDGDDIRVTGLTALAILSGGNTLTRGHLKAPLRGAVRYLLGCQDSRTGCFRMPDRPAKVLDHAIATLAITEVCRLEGSIHPETAAALRAGARRGLAHLTAQRRIGSAWGREGNAAHDDVLVTAFASLALASARDAGFSVDASHQAAALAFWQSLVDAPTGASIASAMVRGDLSAERPVVTAAALLCRLVLGGDPDDVDLRRMAEVVARCPPTVEAAPDSIDYGYWFFGTYAMYQCGGAERSEWQRHLTKTLLKSQIQDGDAAGTWDPRSDPRMARAGRIYATSLATLTLVAFYRYDEVIMAR